jgi:hypothetical protein
VQIHLSQVRRTRGAGPRCGPPSISIAASLLYSPTDPRRRAALWPAQHFYSCLSFIFADGPEAPGRAGARPARQPPQRTAVLRWQPPQRTAVLRWQPPQHTAVRPMMRQEPAPRHSARTSTLSAQTGRHMPP